MVTVDGSSLDRPRYWVSVQLHRSTAVPLAFGLAVTAAAVALLSPAPGRSQSVAAIVPHGVATERKPNLDAVQLPEKWAPSKGRECGRHGRRARPYCQGPRKVPLPFGADAQRAEQLELGTVKAVSHLLLAAPKPEWVAAAGKLDEPTLRWPVDTGKLWRGFEAKRPAKHRHRHKGIDVGAPKGTPIRAVQSGLVVYSDNEVQGYGNLLVVVHPDNSVGLYAHCQSIYVFAGQRVERGRIVAEVGATGIARGAHLHFEYRHKGFNRDPIKKFESVPCGGAIRCEKEDEEAEE
jgi:murein DD-endopeptidase MepM/ murein hydrolase activator NlpD